MQAGKNAMESTKEAAANMGASARAGMDKTRAAVQGQVEKATAHNASDKEAAEVRRQERVQAAEEEKQRATRANAAAKERATGGPGAYHPSQGATGVDPRAAEPTGGHVKDGVAAHNPHVGSDFSQARGTGGQYQ
ncbi:hypothetical protein E2562_029744 [Oryza meyeriana var. granulata]|uniref:Uncharacterized protein n=1 Tax=Oryza meyeriana var. granulata TaxID=110450 RepID=A0A6G1CKE4_9ORYZ|nr:hypothetical protein E2562_029744 [Oryza meyeriana var. granulata]